VPRSSAMVTIR